MQVTLPQRSLRSSMKSSKASAVAYGCMSLHGGPGAPGEEESITIVRHALACGLNLFNTSDLYGKALKNVPREQIVIVDKWGPFWTANGMDVDASPARCRKVIDQQLARLQTDYIDIWVYRGSDPNTPIEETVRAMKIASSGLWPWSKREWSNAGIQEAVTAGKVRHIGLSECNADEIRRAHAIHPIVVLEQEWSLFSRDIEVDLLPTANELGIGVLAYSPLGRGMLTNSIRSLDDLPEKDFRRMLPRFSEAAFKQNRVLVDKLEALATKKGCTTGQLALAWLLHKSPNVIPLFGTKSIKNMEANIAAVHLTLTPDEFETIDTCVPPSEVVGDRSMAWARPYKPAAHAGA